jgi:MFS superfamily sulfate permease-like transporter
MSLTRSSRNFESLDPSSRFQSSWKKPSLSSGKEGAGMSAPLLASYDAWMSDIKEILRKPSVGSDLIAGVTVAAVALPLNLALAVAAGLPPSTGIIAGAVGGFLAGLFGGSRWQVSGPAAALNVMVFSCCWRFCILAMCWPWFPFRHWRVCCV